ncbi:MAG: ATP-binding protein [Oscillospiraceae bacterium]|nr:ATP-binding protein [Oscillospiraceae bacterium]
MKFRDYIKDNAVGISITIFTYFMILFFMYSFRFSKDMILILSIIFFIGFFSRIIWDYFRKKDFYNSLIDNIEQLDKKYLISEIVKEPDFIEGKIIHNILYEMGKSMNENIDIYRKNTEELQEYIELWVHEIKLPVSSLLLMSHNNENNSKYDKELHKIDNYIENVLYYSRIESNGKDYIIKPVNIGKIFRKAAVKNRIELLSMNISINTTGLDKIVTTDEKWLEFIFGQLMNNSMKYVSNLRESEIKIFTEENNDSIILHFRDNGIGISASDLPYIFDKSYTGENGRTHSRSTGMGLYIVKKLCNKLGHKITAESVKNEFTDIIIFFGKNDHVKPN